MTRLMLVNKNKLPAASLVKTSKEGDVSHMTVVQLSCDIYCHV